MSSPTVDPKLYHPSWSLEAYFDREERAETKSEYMNGEIVAMAGAGEEHEIAALNLAAEIQRHLRGKPCRAFKSDMKLKLSLQHADLVYYPDIMITCDPEDSAPNYKERPTLLIEVMSDYRRDHIEKLFAYQQIESLQEYAVVDPNPKTPRVWIYRREDNWTQETIMPPDPVRFTSIDFETALDNIYL